MAIGESTGVVPDGGKCARAGSFSEMEPSARTVALIDLRYDQAVHGECHDAARRFSLTLREIEHTVRGEDRVCPFGTTRIAVAFGSDADVVSPRALAERLARALRQCAQSDSDLRDRGQGISAPRGNGTRRSIDHRAPPARIIVDRAIGRVSSIDQARVVASTTGSNHPGRAPSTVQRWRRRMVLACVVGDFGKYGTRHDDIVPGDRETILVVSPSRTPSGAPGIAATAASTMAERLGYDVGTVILSCDDELVLEVRGTGIELVVLMVEGEHESSAGRPTWASSTWHVLAQLVTRFSARGLRVLAVGAGGGAGALASCAAAGAAIALDLDELQTLLSEGERTLRTGDVCPELCGQRTPQPIETLAMLTATERRVLFYLTTGRSAQDIADEQVVSLTTVRSHIRSILRKLGVRSQLAAVAIANSQDLNRSQPAGVSGGQGVTEVPGVA